ncbi:5'-nucleotidase, lipoprotein e(P4) family [Urechidicola sp. KH5]
MKYFALRLFAIVCLTGIVSCSEINNTHQNAINELPKKEHTLSAVLWQQNAAEYRALSYQAYNIASLRISNLDKSNGKPYAIITDLDETVIDNSPYSAMQIKEDLNFDNRDWNEWGKLENAKALPGAVEFFNNAIKEGVDVFYISNRSEVQIEETIANLKKLNLPNADLDHVFLKTSTSEKQERRDKVLENYDVVLYMGDNLSDFSSAFDNQSSVNRNASTDALKEKFGEKYIVFPNPMYGDWESKGIYENHRNWTEKQKDSIRRAKIYSYK